jgi:drug/metabolite transporter (DMT)-like permease
MVLLDLFLLLVGLGWLFWLGLALAVVGVVLLLMDRRGHPVGRRRSGL